MDMASLQEPGLPQNLIPVLELFKGDNHWPAASNIWTWRLEKNILNVLFNILNKPENILAAELMAISLLMVKFSFITALI